MKASKIATNNNNAGGGGSVDKTGRMAEIDEQILHTFDIKKRLGKGAYGIVWKATDRNTSQTVAVKKIFDAFRNETDAQRTFREVMFLRSFRNHPNIVRLHSIHRAANHMDIYLSFEFMESDLHNVIKRGSILKDIHKRFVMYQLLNATQYIHSGNVIHRDMKPSNVLIDSKCRCKIADFGLARSIGQQAAAVADATSTDLEQAPCLTDYVATRWYRAPEILVASKRYTMGIDMWSLGCILGEMLLGKPLFPGSCTMNQIERIVGAFPCVTDEDVAAVGGGFGSQLLAQGKQVQAASAASSSAGGTKTLEELLAGAPEEARDMVNALLRLDPMKRLTAKQALAHRYIEKFRNTSPENELSGDILPPFRDDVQLTVSDYRSKLYEIMNEKNGYVRRKLDKKDRDLLESSLTVTDQNQRPTVQHATNSTNHNRTITQPPKPQLHHQRSSRASLTKHQSSTATSSTTNHPKSTVAPSKNYYSSYQQQQQQAAGSRVVTAFGCQLANGKAQSQPQPQNGGNQPHPAPHSSYHWASAAHSNHPNHPAHPTHHHQQPSTSSLSVTQTGKSQYRKSTALNRELLSRLDDVCGGGGQMLPVTRTASSGNQNAPIDRRKSVDNGYHQQQQHQQPPHPGHQRRPSLDGIVGGPNAPIDAAPPPSKQMREHHHHHPSATASRLVPSMSKHKLLSALNNRNILSAELAPQPSHQPAKSRPINLSCFRTSTAAAPNPAKSGQQSSAAASGFDSRLRNINEKLSRHSQDSRFNERQRNALETLQRANNGGHPRARNAAVPAQDAQQQQEVNNNVAPSQSDSAVLAGLGRDRGGVNGRGCCDLGGGEQGAASAALLGAVLPGGGQSRAHRFQHLFRTKSEYSQHHQGGRGGGAGTGANGDNGLQQNFQHAGGGDADGGGRLRKQQGADMLGTYGGGGGAATLAEGGRGTHSMVRAADLYKLCPSELVL